MIDTRTLAFVALELLVSTLSVQAQGPPQYRDYQLGGDLVSVSAQTKVPASEAKTIHLRPAVIQELRWRPSYFVGGSTEPQTDPVQQIVFSFYNDKLFRLAIAYDRQRTEGMTDADLVEAISTAYGPPLKPAGENGRVVALPLEDESGRPVARWGDGDYSVVLYRSPYESGFHVVVTSPRLEALARTAGAQAIRLDEREAPQREIARQKKAAEDARVSQEKVRTANKAAFRP